MKCKFTNRHTEGDLAKSKHNLKFLANMIYPMFKPFDSTWIIHSFLTDPKLIPEES